MVVVLGYHLIFGAYGFWLPNDPRGSGSWHVWAEHLRQFGPATRLDDRSRSVARSEHDWRLRLAAKRNLTYPSVKFTGIQAKVFGDGFADYVRRNGVVFWACSILPEHVHLTIGRHHSDIETIAEQLKGASTRRLLKEGLHPFGHIMTGKGRPSCCWQGGSWSPFLETPAEIRSCVRYVEDNPAKEGKPRQHWPFVASYFG